MSNLLREYIRTLLTSLTSLLREARGTPNRGFIFERTIAQGLESVNSSKGSIKVDGVAGNRNDVSDLGITVTPLGGAAPISCGVEIKLNFDANIGSIWLKNFTSLSWSKRTNNFIYEMNKMGPTPSIAFDVAT